MARRRARSDPVPRPTARSALVRSEAVRAGASEAEVVEPVAEVELEAVPASDAPETGPPVPWGVDARPVAALNPDATLDAVVRTTPEAADATDGVGADGTVPTGDETLGVLTLGVATEGVVTEGVVADGVVTDGVVATGVVTDGVVTDGVVTDGALTSGVVTDGVLTAVVATFGVLTDGTVADGTLKLGAVAPARCCGSTAAVPASGCATSTPSAAATTPTTMPWLFPMAYSLCSCPRRPHRR